MEKEIGSLVDPTKTADETGKFTDDFIVPCGGCLQVMSEFQMKQKEKIKVLLYRADEEVMLGVGIENFLPLQFILKK